MIQFWISDFIINGIIFFITNSTKLINDKGESDDMKICDTLNVERIIIHPNDEPHESHYIDIIVDGYNPIFYVNSCCDNEWEWAFWYSKTNYELVKYVIMDCITTCDTMEELINALDEIFDEECRDITFNEAELQTDEWECDGDCENCGFNEDK